MTSTTTQKVAFIKFEDERCVEVGQHLTNTVLVDRALVCVPWLQGEWHLSISIFYTIFITNNKNFSDTIPDETTFLNSGGPSMAGGRQLPPHVQNRIQNDADGHSIVSISAPRATFISNPVFYSSTALNLF